MLPNDPVMLLSTVNTLLRDEYAALSELCLTENVSEDALCAKLSEIGYTYDPVHNQFR